MFIIITTKLNTEIFCILYIKFFFITFLPCPHYTAIIFLNLIDSTVFFNGDTVCFIVFKYHLCSFSLQSVDILLHTGVTFVKPVSF